MTQLYHILVVKCKYDEMEFTLVKLKKYKFNVTGVAFVYVGVGIGVCKKAGVTVDVMISA